MSSLIRFELKKNFSRRVVQISLGGVLAMLCVIALFNITSQYASNPNQVGGKLDGCAAIAQIKANATTLSGAITDEKATEILNEYKSFLDSEGEAKDEYRTDRSTPSAKAEEYWKFNAINDAYLNLLLRPWMEGYQMPDAVITTIDTSRNVDLYGQVRTKIESQLAKTDGSFTYTEAEKDFWLSKAEAVPTPVAYGDAGGWEDFLELVQFLIFALLAVVITCAGIFNVEYREKTDAILLSTKLGKSRLGNAKVLAAFIASSAIYGVFALLLLMVPLIFFGVDGAGLPLQAQSLTNTYRLSFSAASLICCLIGYLVMLGLLGIVLLLSARMKSSMGILALGVVIVIVPLFIPNLHNNLANHALFLFPYHALNPHNLFDMVSYSTGSLVVTYPVMLTILYSVLFVGGSLLAIRSFNKHQVG